MNILYQPINANLFTGNPTSIIQYSNQSSAAWSGYYGIEFKTGFSNPITVSGLGRWKIAGNALPHRVILQRVLPAPLDDQQTGTYIPNIRSEIVASAIVQNQGASGTYNYANLEQPVVLDPNTDYYLASYESYGGDGEDFMINCTSWPTTNYAMENIWGIVETDLNYNVVHPWTANPFNISNNITANVNMIIQ
jgi:hypothetical protein